MWRKIRARWSAEFVPKSTEFSLPPAAHGQFPGLKGLSFRAIGPLLSEGDFDQYKSAVEALHCRAVHIEDEGVMDAEKGRELPRYLKFGEVAVDAFEGAVEGIKISPAVVGLDEDDVFCLHLGDQFMALILIRKEDRFFRLNLLVVKLLCQAPDIVCQ